MGSFIIKKFIEDYNSCKKGIFIDNKINVNFFSSMLFIVPLLYGYYNSFYLIIHFCAMCMFTSVLHHYHNCDNKIFGYIDKICVNSIALGILLYMLLNTQLNIYSIITYIISLITISIYLYIQYNIRYDKYYFLVHIFSNIGILFCIKTCMIHFKNYDILSNIA